MEIGKPLSKLRLIISYGVTNSDTSMSPYFFTFRYSGLDMKAGSEFHLNYYYETHCSFDNSVHRRISEIAVVCNTSPDDPMAGVVSFVTNVVQPEYIPSCETSVHTNCI